MSTESPDRPAQPPAGAPAAAAATAAPAAPPARRRVWPWILLGCGIGVLGALMAEAVLGIVAVRVYERKLEAQHKAALEFLRSSPLGKPPAAPPKTQAPADPRQQAEDARKEMDAQRQKLEQLRKSLEAAQKSGKSSDSEALKQILGDTDAFLKMLDEFDKETRDLLEDETLDPKPGERRR